MRQFEEHAFEIGLRFAILRAVALGISKADFRTHFYRLLPRSIRGHEDVFIAHQSQIMNWVSGLDWSSIPLIGEYGYEG